jgi:hypothetical protein
LILFARKNPTDPVHYDTLFLCSRQLLHRISFEGYIL